MGKLTDSLKNTSNDLDAIETSIRKIAKLGDELAENTFEVADSALRAGYQYAQLESQDVEELVSSKKTENLLKASEIEKELKATQTSQSRLRTWNDIYRIQGVLIIEYLKEKRVDSSIIEDVNSILKLNGVSQSPELASRLLTLEKSKVIQILMKAVKYTKHLLQI